MSGPRVAVVGGGIIGESVAWALARRGAAVTVFDPDPLRGAGRVAAGMLAPVTEAAFGEDDLLAANLAAATAWPAFVAEVEADADRDLGHVACGALTVAADADELAIVDRHGAFLHGLGLEAERLSSRDARRREPALAPSTRGAWWVPGDAQVDPRRVLDALRIANDRHGVAAVRRLVTAVTATTVVTPGAPGCEDGRESFDAVVVAAGWASGRLLGLPVRPVKGQILRVRDTGRSVVPRHLIRGVEVYVVPRADEIVIGATTEDRGDDTTVTAGAVRHLLEEANRLLPGLDEAELIETAAGLRPGTPDSAPILDTVDGVVVATGHYRNGILQAPWTAAAVADAVLGDGWPAATAPFRATRFARHGRGLTPTATGVGR